MPTTLVELILKSKKYLRDEWHDSNPILYEGEFGIESDTRQFKIGDGVTKWKDLPYASSEQATYFRIPVIIGNTQIIGAIDEYDEYGHVINTKQQVITPKDVGYIPAAGGGFFGDLYNEATLYFNSLPDPDPWDPTITRDQRYFINKYGNASLKYLHLLKSDNTESLLVDGLSEFLDDIMTRKNIYFGDANPNNEKFYNITNKAEATLKDLYLTDTLIVDKTSNFKDNVTFYKYLYFANGTDYYIDDTANAVLNTLTVKNETYLEDILNVYGNTTIGNENLPSTLEVFGNTTIHGSDGLTVDKNAIIRTDLYVNGNTRIGAPTYIDSNGDTITVPTTLDVYSATTFYENVTALSKVLFNNDIEVNGNSLFNKDININGIFTSLNSTAALEDSYTGELTGSIIATGGVAIKKNLIVKDTVNVKNRLYVKNGTTLYSTLEVSGCTLLYDDLAVTGNVLFNANLIVMEDTVLSSTLKVIGATTLKDTLEVDKKTTLNDELEVVKSTVLKDTLDVTKSTILRDTLETIGATTLKDTLNVDKKTTLNDELEVIKSTVLKDTLSVTGNTVIGDSSTPSTLTVWGSTTLKDTLSVDKKTTLNDELEVIKSTVLKDTLSVDKKTTLNDELEVAKSTVLGDTLSVTGNTVIGNNSTASTLTVWGATTLKSTLDVDGKTTLNDKLEVIKSTLLRDTLDVYKDVTIGIDTTDTANLSVHGNTLLYGNLDVSGTSLLNGFVTLGKNPTNSMHAATKKYVDDTIKNFGATVYRGTIGKVYEKQPDGTIVVTKHPLADYEDVPTENVYCGDEYEIISDGNYAGYDDTNTDHDGSDYALSKGDIVIAKTTGATVQRLKENWSLIPSGDRGEVTLRYSITESEVNLSTKPKYDEIIFGEAAIHQVLNNALIKENNAWKINPTEIVLPIDDNTPDKLINVASFLNHMGYMDYARLSGANFYGDVSIGSSTNGKILTVWGATTLKDTLNVIGVTTLENTTQSSTINDGSLIVKGGVGIAKQVNIGGITKITDTTSSSSSTTGALVVAGGIATSNNIWSDKNIYMNGSLYVGHSTAANAIIYLNNKLAIKGIDSWLRINDTSAFTSGVYFGDGIIRTDGTFQIGNNGEKLLASTTGLTVNIPSLFTNSFTLKSNNYSGKIVAKNNNDKLRWSIYSDSNSGAIANTVLKVYKDDTGNDTASYIFGSNGTFTTVDEVITDQLMFESNNRAGYILARNANKNSRWSIFSNATNGSAADTVLRVFSDDTGAKYYDYIFGKDGAFKLTTLNVTGNTTIGDSNTASTLTVWGATTLNSTLSVKGNTTIGNSSTASTLTVWGATTLENTLNVKENTTLEKTLSVKGNTTLEKTLSVKGNTTIGNSSTASTLTVWGATALKNNVTIGNSTTEAVTTVYGSVTFEKGSAGDNSSFNVKTKAVFDQQITGTIDKAVGDGDGNTIKSTYANSLIIDTTDVSNDTNSPDSTKRPTKILLKSKSGDTLSTVTVPYAVFSGYSDYLRTYLETSVSSETAYYLTGVTNTTNTVLTKKAMIQESIKILTLTGTTTAGGHDILSLGNSTVSGNNGNKKGYIRLYSNNDKCHDITPADNPSTNYTHSLPNATGTLVTNANLAQTLAGAITFSNIVKFTNTEDSNNLLTGAVQISGGMSVSKNILAGGYLTFKTNTYTGNIIAKNSSGHKRYELWSNSNLGAVAHTVLRVYTDDTGNNYHNYIFGIDGIFSTPYANISGDTDSSSTTTGALKVAGGVGIAKQLRVGSNATITGKVIVNDTTDATATTDSSSIHTEGGISAKKNVAAKSFKVADKVSIEYDETEQCLEFIFA